MRHCNSIISFRSPHPKLQSPYSPTSPQSQTAKIRQLQTGNAQLTKQNSETIARIRSKVKENEQLKSRLQMLKGLLQRQEREKISIDEMKTSRPESTTKTIKRASMEVNDQIQNLESQFEDLMARCQSLAGKQRQQARFMLSLIAQRLRQLKKQTKKYNL